MITPTRTQVLQKYPRLVAHMICESLGYFSVMSAASALCCYIHRKPCYCEWYSHMASFRPGHGTELEIMDVGADVVKWAFQRRHHHNGYMAEYAHAIQLVRAELANSGATSGMLASWF